MRTQIMNLTEELLVKTVGNRPCLVSGMPGSGKDYVADKILSKYGSVILLDQLGYVKDGKFLIDLNLLKEVSPSKGGLYYVGMCDNVREVYGALVTLYPNVLPALIWVSPTPELFRRSNLLKKDLAPAGVLITWKKIWEKRSKMSDQAIAKLDRNEMEFFASRMGLDTILNFKNEFTSSLSDVTEGWHKWASRKYEEPKSDDLKYEVIEVLSNDDYSTIRVSFDLSEPWNEYFCAVTMARDVKTHSLYFWRTPYAEESETWTTKVNIEGVKFESLRSLVVKRASILLEHFMLRSTSSPVKPKEDKPSSSEATRRDK